MYTSNVHFLQDTLLYLTKTAYFKLHYSCTTTTFWIILNILRNAKEIQNVMSKIFWSVSGFNFEENIWSISSGVTFIYNIILYAILNKRQPWQAVLSVWEQLYYSWTIYKCVKYMLAKMKTQKSSNWTSPEVLALPIFANGPFK